MNFCEGKNHLHIGFSKLYHDVGIFSVYEIVGAVTMVDFALFRARSF